MNGDLARLDWRRWAFDPDLLAWAQSAFALSQTAITAPELAHWWVCEGTWFLGVDALDNDDTGRLPDGINLPTSLTDQLTTQFGPLPLHKAQISVVRPGYPRPRDNESTAAFRFREIREAAHVDGLKAEGPERQRMVKEPHAYILGLPLNAPSTGTSPLVIWEGSQEIMRAALTKALAPFPEDTWGDVDITKPYQAARREVFERCNRITVSAAPGEAYLMHRLTVHGIAKWQAPDVGDRRIAYFRPDLGSVREWLENA